MGRQNYKWSNLQKSWRKKATLEKQNQKKESAIMSFSKTSRIVKMQNREKEV